jgi:hypothetical protein
MNKQNTHRRIMHEKVNRVPDRKELLQNKINLEIKRSSQFIPPVIKNTLDINLDNINKLLLLKI